MLPLSLILLILAPTSASARHLIAGVPFIPQQRNRCGPASLAMIFHYYRVPIKSEELAREIYERRFSGALNLDLLIAARRHGFAAQAQSGDLELLKSYLRREIPVIALVRPRSGADRTNPTRYHFLVVYGFDDGSRQFTVHSARRGGQKISYQTFQRRWRPTGNWMLTVERREE